MSYQVRLEVFEGPFDLLLHLIAKRELDIYEVSLAQITEEYLEHLRTMTELDLEVATGFLLVAATLIELKASRLLPGTRADDDELMAMAERDVLIARLLEYRAFKDAAERLAAMIVANAGYAGREAGPGSDFSHLLPDVLARVKPQELADIAVGALTPKRPPRVDVSHITPIRATVGEAAIEIGAILRDRGRATFRELTTTTPHRIDVVVRFLALLELYKRGYVELTQLGTFGDIEATWTAPEDASLRDIETEEGW